MKPDDTLPKPSGRAFTYPSFRDSHWWLSLFPILVISHLTKWLQDLLLEELLIVAHSSARKTTPCSLPPSLSFSRKKGLTQQVLRPMCLMTHKVVRPKNPPASSPVKSLSLSDQADFLVSVRRATSRSLKLLQINKEETRTLL